MTYGDRTLLLNFANKVRAASLQHGPGHYLMSGNPTSEIGPTERRKAMDESWMAAQTEILSAERVSAEAMEMASLLRLLNRSTRHCASDPVDQAYDLPGLAYGRGASELDPRFDQTVTEAYIQTRRYTASRNQAKFLHATGAPTRSQVFLHGFLTVGTQTRHHAPQKYHKKHITQPYLWISISYFLVLEF